ncbi:MAG TPA: alpha/beta hydrolase, partial [archaeon]|nr:alpha/beta hydrolase [archaeon]
QVGAPPSEEAKRFVRAISPESYVAAIGPRPVLLIHFKNDTGIPLAAAEDLYNRAGGAAQLWALDRSYHGYDDALVPALLESEVAAKLTG